MRKLYDETIHLRLRKLGLLVYDVFAIYLAGVLALLIRFEFHFGSRFMYFLDIFETYYPVVVVISIAIFAFFHMYTSLWKFASVAEMEKILIACLLSIVSQYLVINLLPFGTLRLPRSYFVIVAAVLCALECGCRFAYRALRSAFDKRVERQIKTNVMVVGAGSAGYSLIREIMHSKKVNKRVVCVIDDSSEKQGNYINGIKIAGGRNDIPKLVKKYNVQEIMIAMPTVPENEIKNILNICKNTGCELKRLPGMYQLVNGDVSISRLKKVDVNDLLGREPVQVDLDSVMGYVSQKVIMVTGGGGSIGSELCRQIASYHPKQLIIVDIYENTTYDVQNELKERFPKLDLVVLIASVRNINRMDWIFRTYHPEIVYHAAAHKHVPLMEDSPNEAIKNNVLGTWKLVQAADKWNVKRFVMISTDKAVNPTNIMGASKRLCEMIVQTYNNRSQTEFVAVRFGNVLGSNGSVIPLFRKQIEKGGPVTVTHPDIIRYFMTIPEAVALVLQAGAFAKGGEIFVLDMGEPVKILALAQNLILLSGHKLSDIEIRFTGLRPGEKLYEEMLMEEEGLLETENKMIHIGKPIELDDEQFMKQLNELAEYVIMEPSDIREYLKKMVPTYHPKEN